MHKSERYPTMNHARHLLREAGMKPLPSDKRFLMKLRAAKRKWRKE